MSKFHINKEKQADYNKKKAEKWEKKAKRLREKVDKMLAKEDAMIIGILEPTFNSIISKIAIVPRQKNDDKISS